MEPEAGNQPSAPHGAPWEFLQPAPFGLDVAFGDVPVDLPDATQPRRWIHVADQTVLVRFPGDRRVLVEDGQRVTIHWPTNADDEGHDHSWAISSWAVPLAMLQRGFLPLHASTVRVGDAVVAVAGQSGSGKSTTAFGLSLRGHELIVDETTLLEATDDGVLFHPFPRRINLTQATAQRLGFAPEDTQPVAQSRGKVALTHAPRSLDPMLLTHVVALQAPVGSDVEIEPLTGALAVAMLSVHAERLGIAPLVLGRQRYLALLHAVSERTSVVTLRRPANGWSLDAVIDAIEGLVG